MEKLKNVEKIEEGDLPFPDEIWIHIVKLVPLAGLLLINAAPKIFKKMFASELLPCMNCNSLVLFDYTNYFNNKKSNANGNNNSNANGTNVPFGNGNKTPFRNDIWLQFLEHIVKKPSHLKLFKYDNLLKWYCHCGRTFYCENCDPSPNKCFYNDECNNLLCDCCCINIKVVGIDWFGGNVKICRDCYLKDKSNFTCDI